MRCMRPYFTVRFVYEARWFKVCIPSAECRPETTSPSFVQEPAGSGQKDRNTFWQYLRRKDAWFMSWPGNEGAVAPSEEPVISSLQRRQGRPVHAWTLPHKEFLLQGEYLIQQLYTAVLKHLRKVSEDSTQTSGGFCTWPRPTPHRCLELFLIENDMAVVPYPTALRTYPPVTSPCVERWKCW